MEKIVPINMASGRAASGLTAPTQAVPAQPIAAPSVAESLLALHERLIGCAETQVLLQRFLYWTQQQALADGLSYRRPEEDDGTQLGERRHHQSTYQLQLDGEDIGTLVLCRRERYAESELVVLERALGCLCRCLKNAHEMEVALKAARHDSLTGLLNRKAMDERLREEIGRARRQSSPLSILLLDIDHFKLINDTQGHLAGDRVLRALARIFTTSVRDVDLVFRHGGDEFAVILPHTNLEHAQVLAERIRALLPTLHAELAALQEPGAPLRPDLSIGAAEYHAGDNEHALLQRADTHLYHAKAHGRGRVCARV